MRLNTQYTTQAERSRSESRDLEMAQSLHDAALFYPDIWPVLAPSIEYARIAAKRRYRADECQ
jgi:hypothetical protein